MEKEVKKNTNKKKMTREQIEKKKKRIIKTFWIIVAIIVLVIAAFIANDFIIFDKNTKTNLVINNKNVTANLKNDVIIEDDVIYLSKQDIANFFDKYIYEEKENNEIITTYEKKIASIGFEENEVIINGSKKKISAHAIKKDDTIYLPFSEMSDVYDVEITNIPDTKVVTADSFDKEQIKAMVTSDCAVKSSTNFIAKTVDRVKKGDYVVVVSENDGFARIRTENGKLGYIKQDKLTGNFTVRENLEEEKQIEGKINLVWDYYSEVASAPNRQGTTIDGVNVVSPSFMYLDKNGKLKENIGNSGQSYISWAHEQGYKVWPMVSNSGDGMLEVTSKVMNSYENRQELIESIVDVCVKNKLDGVNIDFENMKVEDIDLYSRFIIELTPRLKEIGLVTSVDVTAPDGGDTWSMCFDRNVIGDVADYIVFMAYDEYGSGSDKAGTTAGYDWVKLSLNKFLQTEEIESTKIILGVPFYTRMWTTSSSGKVTSNTVDMKNIDKAIPAGVDKTWDEDLKQNYIEFTEGSNKKQMWIEDIESLKNKVSLINENNLAGVACWQKGMETDEVWEMLKENLK